MTLPSTVDPPDAYGWDWSSTTHDGDQTGVALLAAALRPSSMLPGKGKHGWTQSVQCFDDEGFKLGQVYYGGERDDVFVEATSSAAHESRRRVLRFDPDARTSRVDTRVDTLVPYDQLVALALDVAGPRTKVAEWRGGVGSFENSTGRTLYVGAPSSDVRVRIYEKWLESPGQYEDGTNRVEVQLRPPSRGKRMVSEWEPGETFCATKLTRRIAAELGQHVYPVGSLQKSKGTPDLEKSLEAMGHQYGKVVREWLDLSSGDLGRVLEHLEV